VENPDDRSKRSWNTPGQWSVRLWLLAVVAVLLANLILVCAGYHPKVGQDRGGQELPGGAIVIAVAAVLLALAGLTSVIALIKRKAGDRVELLAALTGLAVPVLVFSVVVLRWVGLLD
jgi:hypothetical protein